jgi:hypothetical protein
MMAMVMMLMSMLPIPLGAENTLPELVVRLTSVLRKSIAETTPSITAAGFVQGIANPDECQGLPILAVFLTVAAAHATTFWCAACAMTTTVFGLHHNSMKLAGL